MPRAAHSLSPPARSPFSPREKVLRDPRIKSGGRPDEGLWADATRFAMCAHPGTVAAARPHPALRATFSRREKGFAGHCGGVTSAFSHFSDSDLIVPSAIAAPIASLNFASSAVSSLRMPAPVPRPNTPPRNCGPATV